MTPPNSPALPIAEADRRMTMYTTIAKFHALLVEAKWKARTAGKAMDVTPLDMINIGLHNEAAIAFLAEELLTLGAIVAKTPGAKDVVLTD